MLIVGVLWIVVAADAGASLLPGVALVITSVGGLVGATAAFVGAWRRQKPPHSDNEQAGSLWTEMLERLDAVEDERDQLHAENERLRSELASANKERLALLRRLAAERLK